MSASPVIDAMLPDALHVSLRDAQAQVNALVLGKPQQVRLAFVALLADGHLLIEDLPGLGKTTLAHALAATLGLGFQRVQFTSDLLPSDIVGVSIFDAQARRFEKVWIKIGGGPPGGQAQPGGVDIVRPFLEGLHNKTASGKSSAKPQ